MSATKVFANHLAPDEVIAACERSLRHLQMDYIDLYQIHWPNHEIPLAETVGALERLREQGKVRAIGVSNFGVGNLSDMLALTACESNQLPFSLLWRVIEREIQPLCVEHDVSLICYSPLAQGLLTGRYASLDDVPDGLARSRLFHHERAKAIHGEAGCEAAVLAAVAELRHIADELGEPMAAVALAWVRQQAGVASLLVGARNADEVSWNLPSLELTLAEETVQALNKATEPVKACLGNNPDVWQSPSRYR